MSEFRGFVYLLKAVLLKHPYFHFFVFFEGIHVHLTGPRLIQPIPYQRNYRWYKDVGPSHNEVCINMLSGKQLKQTHQGFATTFTAFYLTVLLVLHAPQEGNPVYNIKLI